MGQVSESDFYSAVQPWLQTTISLPVGLVKPPTIPANRKYAVIYPITNPSGEGSWADPEEDREFVFQVTSFGRVSEEALWVNDLVQRAILDRGANGDYLHPLIIAGISIHWRQSDGSGATIAGGVDLYQIPATYRFRTGA